jgi:cytochrome c oxidase subunit 1
MATHEFAAHASHAHEAPQGFIRKWVFSLDHKVIGLQYYFLALAAVFVGMFLSLLMRIHLIWPNVPLPILGEIKPETYLTLVTMHGTIMVFFVHHGAAGGFGITSCDSDRRAGHGVPV